MIIILLQLFGTLTFVFDCCYFPLFEAYQCLFSDKNFDLKTMVIKQGQLKGEKQQNK